VTRRSTTHATFVIERTYDASPARVFHAWADPAAKAGWFAGTDECGDAPGWTEQHREQDFRVGGRERLRGGPPQGPVHAFDAIYQDIVPDQRIVYSYDMHVGGTRISVSLATVELEPDGAGTRLTFTEQSVFLDGADNRADRERGTRDLLNSLDAALRRASTSHHMTGRVQ
jgi:uncharacterized protein YndB with AHSA1/START domain